MAVTPTGSNSVMDQLQDTMNPKATGKKSTAEEAQDRFMKLLITQMKNQDPLSPLDNAQFTSQLAQLNTVTGIDKLNDTLTALQGSYQATQTTQAAVMIDHGILAPGSKVVLAEGKALLGYELSHATENVTINVKNAKGVIVKTMDVGAGTVGTTPIQWDGKDNEGKPLDNGVYSFEVKATTNGIERTITQKDGSEKSVATPLQFGYVNSVSTNAQGVRLNATGFSSPLAMGDVREIL